MRGGDFEALSMSMRVLGACLPERTALRDYHRDYMRAYRANGKRPLFKAYKKATPKRGTRLACTVQICGVRGEHRHCVCGLPVSLGIHRCPMCVAEIWRRQERQSA